jgi:hypothetical protein
MEEGVLDIELVNWTLARESPREHCVNRGGLDDRTEGLGKVDAQTLGEAVKDPTCLVALQRTVCVELVFEDPLAHDNVGMSWARNQLPSLVLEKGSMFFLHSSSPIEIGKGATEGLRNRGQWRSMV